jgi:peptidoglycan DL-endopeptidase CwlO
MGLLHRLRRRLIRLGRPSLPAPTRGRVPLPTPFILRAPALLVFGLALGVGLFFCVTTAPVQAEDTSTTIDIASTTTSTDEATTSTDSTTLTDPPTSTDTSTTTTTSSPTTTTTTKSTTTTWWSPPPTIYPWWTTTTTFVATVVTTVNPGVQLQIDDLTAQAQAVQARMEALTDELERKAEEYNKCLEDLNTANARMAELRRMVASAQADKARQQALLAQRIKSVYMSGGRDQLLQLLLLADSLQDFYNRVRVVSMLADQDQRLIADLKSSSTRLDLLTQAVDDQKSKQLALKQQVARQADAIQAAQTEQATTLASLDSRVKAVLDQEQARQAAEQARLQGELQAQLQARLSTAALLASSGRTHTLNGGQVYPGPLPQSDNDVTNQLIQTAAAYMGCPYVWGGGRPTTGMDCSGFTSYVFRQHGVNLPHYSGYQAEMGIPVAPADIQPGDLVAFGSPVHHVGIYIGNGLFIHTPGDYVKIQKLSSRGDLSAIRRFPLQMRTGPPRFD